MDEHLLHSIMSYANSLHRQLKCVEMTDRQTGCNVCVCVYVCTGVCSTCIEELGQNGLLHYGSHYEYVNYKTCIIMHV